MHSAKNEISCVTKNIKESYRSDNVTFEDLVMIKYGNQSELIKSLMNSDEKMF